MGDVDRKRKRGALEDISNKGRPNLRMTTRHAMKAEPRDVMQVEPQDAIKHPRTEDEMGFPAVCGKKMKLDGTNPVKLRRSARLPPAETPPAVPAELSIQERQRLFDIKMNASNSEFELNVYVDEVVMIDTKETDLLAREIDQFHRKDEDDKHRMLTDFIKEAKTDLSARMRMILIDWLVEVGEEYKVSSKALHLAICLVDRCLASMTLHRSELQLMGCACMILASKYEDVHAPTVEDLVYISDHTYTGDRMLEMESMVLDALEFRVSSTHLYHFLERFVLAGCTTDVQTHFAHYVAELAMLDYPLVQKFKPSVIAAASVYLSRVVTGEATFWTPTLHYYSKYNGVQILECVHQLHKVHEKEYTVLHTDTSQTKAITDKYMSRKHFRVCKIAPVPLPA